MNLRDHPGFMRYDDGSIEVLHADWPVYPAGHGWKTALQSLSMFPQNVLFQKIDDIDHCLLLLATGPGPCLAPSGDLFDERWFHVAIWREDLVALCNQRFVKGATEYEAALAFYAKYKNLLGNQTCPNKEAFEDDQPTIGLNKIALTPTGFQANLAAARPIDSLSPQIKERARPLLAIPFFDTAVREAGVILETRLREIVGSSAFEQDLIRDYYNVICSCRGESAFFKVLRGELRTLFKFVRNDFAHSLREIKESQCRSILDRMSQALDKVNQVES